MRETGLMSVKLCGKRVRITAFGKRLYDFSTNIWGVGGGPKPKHQEVLNNFLSETKIFHYLLF